jgi:hypothetical protein
VNGESFKFPIETIIIIIIKRRTDTRKEEILRLYLEFLRTFSLMNTTQDSSLINDLYFSLRKLAVWLP